MSPEALAVPVVTIFILELSSHELGLGNNFGLDAPDNVLSRAACVGTSPTLLGIGRSADDRPSLQGLDLETTGDGQHSSQDAKGSRMSGDGSKGNSFKKEGSKQRGPLPSKKNYSYRNNRSSRPNGLPTCPLTPTPASPARVDDGRHCAGGARPP